MTYHLPLINSVSEELHLHSLIQYAALAADAHACTTERKSWKKSHFPVSNLWLVDLESAALLTWPREHFTSNSCAKSDRYKQASKITEISAPNSLVWGSLRLAPIKNFFCQIPSNLCTVFPLSMSVGTCHAKKINLQQPIQEKIRGTVARLYYSTVHPSPLSAHTQNIHT